MLPEIILILKLQVFQATRSTVTVFKMTSCFDDSQYFAAITEESFGNQIFSLPINVKGEN